MPHEGPAVEPVRLDVRPSTEELTVEILALERSAEGDGEDAPLRGADLLGLEVVRFGRLADALKAVAGLEERLGSL